MPSPEFDYVITSNPRRRVPKAHILLPDSDEPVCRVTKGSGFAWIVVATEFVGSGMYPVCTNCEMIHAQA